MRNSLICILMIGCLIAGYSVMLLEDPVWAAPITDPVAIKFSNEWIRTWAEADVAHARLTVEFLAEYNAKEIALLVPNTSDAIDDGREAEGVSRLTGIDYIAVVTQAQARDIAYKLPGVADVIHKPTVRRAD